jgi:hypothetical protein
MIGNVPQDVVDAARLLTKWMAENGYERWQIDGCADRASVERLQREIHAHELLADSDRMFLSTIKSRLTGILKDIGDRR